MDRAYETWYEKYQIQRKKERRENRILMISVLAVFVVMGCVVRYVFSGEYKFLGHATTNVYAEIYKLRPYHLGYGYFKQSAYLKYDVGEVTYYGKTRLKKTHHFPRIYPEYIGKKVLLKIAKDDPTVYVAYP